METKDTVENKPRTLEEWEEAIGVLAQAQIDLQAVVKAQGELIQAQDTAIKALAKLQTSDHVRLQPDFPERESLMPTDDHSAQPTEPAWRR